MIAAAHTQITCVAWFNCGTIQKRNRLAHCIRLPMYFLNWMRRQIWMLRPNLFAGREPSELDQKLFAAQIIIRLLFSLNAKQRMAHNKITNHRTAPEHGTCFHFGYYPIHTADWNSIEIDFLSITHNWNESRLICLRLLCMHTICVCVCVSHWIASGIRWWKTVLLRSQLKHWKWDEKSEGERETFLIIENVFAI